MMLSGVSCLCINAGLNDFKILSQKLHIPASVLRVLIDLVASVHFISEPSNTFTIDHDCVTN